MNLENLENATPEGRAMFLRAVDTVARSHGAFLTTREALAQALTSTFDATPEQVDKVIHAAESFPRDPSNFEGGET